VLFKKYKKLSKSKKRATYICIMINVKSVQALIHLVDDPDNHVFEHVRDKIKSYGKDAIPFLENSWESQDFGLLFQHRIENIIHEIQFEDVKKDLRLWKNSLEKDLLKAAIIIAKFQYPGLDENFVLAEIDKIKKAIWLEINENQTAFEKIKIFNKVFYEMQHFRGNTKSFHSPLNSFINTVLETRKGNPLSLSLIYSYIAQELGIPVFGVNLPNHFCLCYMDENQTQKHLDEKNKYGVLFYINTYSKGTIFNENDIKQFLLQLKVNPERSHFEPCSNSVIIQRMLSNLIASFQQVGNSEKVQELISLRSIFTE
jgi:regulator of sirC expression with transglutaminase-like and TPR domain